MSRSADDLRIGALRERDVRDWLVESPFERVSVVCERHGWGKWTLFSTTMLTQYDTDMLGKGLYASPAVQDEHARTGQWTYDPEGWEVLVFASMARFHVYRNSAGQPVDSDFRRRMHVLLGLRALRLLNEEAFRETFAAFLTTVALIHPEETPLLVLSDWWETTFTKRGRPRPC